MNGLNGRAGLANVTQFEMDKLFTLFHLTKYLFNFIMRV